MKGNVAVVVYAVVSGMDSRMDRVVMGEDGGDGRSVLEQVLVLWMELVGRELGRVEH